MPYKDAEKQRAFWRARQQRRRDANPALRKEQLRRQLENPRERAAYNGIEREKYRRKQGARVENIPFLAYDGEGIKNRFVVLANSREYIASKKRLTTLECLEFLTRDYDDNPFRVLFAGDYDVTKILQDLPVEKLAELSRTTRVKFDEYLITHYPGKMFVLRKWGEGKRYRYYDAWGFFQKSFLRTVEEYAQSGLEITAEQQALLEWGKEARATFELKDWQQIIDYNHAECVLLEGIMKRLRGALYDAGMRPLQWHGPGVIAEILLDRARSQRHKETTFPDELLRRAYYGGRIEILKRGQIQGPVYDYDIRSAYPHALASYKRPAHPYRKMQRYEPGKVGLYTVTWNAGDAAFPQWNDRDWPEKPCIIGPFPYRLKDESISFPPIGRGVYHAVEVDAAIRMYGEASEPGAPGIHVESGLVAAPRDEPFRTIIEQWYGKRMEHKRRNDLTQVAYKLGLNSAYGKLAQRVGRRKHGDMFLAGFITAYTRAMLLDVARQCPGDIISFATDGVLTRVPLDVSQGESLGEWECQQFEAIDVLMAGIYRLHRNGEAFEAKSRGWIELDFDAAMDDMQNGRAPNGVRIRNRAFVTYKLAVHSPHEYGPLLGRFVERYRDLNPESGQKRIWHADTPYIWRGNHWRADGFQERLGIEVAGFGVDWQREEQRSIASPLVGRKNGDKRAPLLPLSLDEIEPSLPINDRSGSKTDAWILVKEHAEDAYLLNHESLPLFGE